MLPADRRRAAMIYNDASAQVVELITLQGLPSAGAIQSSIKSVE